MLKGWLIKGVHSSIVLALLILVSQVIANPSNSETTVSPRFDLIPENTLRLYVFFSNPMERGQVRDKIYLFDITNNRRVLNPFLNLNTELWDEEQNRLTLIFDPGRVKYLVGPNLKYGPPLVKKNRYALIIEQGMTNAFGETFEMDIRHTFVAGEAEVRAISPATDWKIDLPIAGTTRAVHIQFDRLMDEGAASRLIGIRNMADSESVAGEIFTDGKQWRFEPEHAWKSGNYELVVNKSLEDVSGNTLNAPFNVQSDKSRSSSYEPLFIRFKVLP